MRNPFPVFIAVLLILSTGCSIMKKTAQESIVGTWTGETAQGTEMTLAFREDMTMIMSGSMDGNDFSLEGKYTADLTKSPATVDLLDMELPQGNMTISCLGIAEFHGPGKMNLYGIFGESGGISRPTEFDRNPSDRRQFYIELKKQ